MSCLQRWGLLTGGRPNNAAVALFACKMAEYPQMALRMARFRGTEKLSFIDNQRVADLPEPEYSILADGTIVITFRKAAFANLPANLPAIEKRILEELIVRPKSTYDELAQMTGKTRETVRVHIKALQDAKLLKRQGADKNGYWKVEF